MLHMICSIGLQYLIGVNKPVQNKSRNDEPLSPADSLDQTIISPNMAFSPENQGKIDFKMMKNNNITSSHEQPKGYARNYNKKRTFDELSQPKD